MPLTKIVCTLGPASSEPGILRAMMASGMTVARLNFSHGSAEEKRALVERIRNVAREEKRFIAILGDLQGPKIRVGQLPEGGLQLQEGQEVELAALSSYEGGPIPFPHPDILRDLRPNHRLLLDDGNLEMQVIEARTDLVRCRILVGGKLSSKKGVNLPGVPLSLSALTEKDRQDARLALELGLDYLALSFVRKASDVLELRQYLVDTLGEVPTRQVGRSPHVFPAIVAKIEKPEALNNLHEIIQVSDAVMVARGDLGVETSPEKVPLAQKRIIRFCNLAGKPVITATQMLQSMVDSPRPTRAEASDVANAILDGSDAVMLSNETATGRYPVEAVAMMSRIAETLEASNSFPYCQDFHDVANPQEEAASQITRAISHATVEIAESVQATAILTSSESGRTARMIARHRPKVPLLGLTPFEESARRMNLVWGVTPTLVDNFQDTDHMIKAMLKAAIGAGYAQIGEEVVLSAGIPLEVHGVTNMLKVHTVRNEDLA